jgi:hypothetical protein
VRFFLRGLSASLARPQFALAIWLVQAGLAAALAIPISNFLHSELNRSPSGRSMIEKPDFRWWEAERRAHPDLLGDLPDAVLDLVSTSGADGFERFNNVAGIGAALLSIGAVAVVLHAFLLGGILGGLRDPAARDLVAFARDGARRFPAFVVVTAAAAGMATAVYVHVFVASGRLLADFSDSLPTESSSFLLVVARVLLLALLLTAIKIAADSVRIALVERPDLPPVTRVLVGLGSAAGSFRAALMVLAWAALTLVGLTFLWFRLSVKSAATTTGGVVLLVAAEQVYIFLRSILKVGYYAGLREAVRRPAPVRPTPASDLISTTNG